MTTSSSRASAPWEPVTVRGRSCARTTVPDLDGPDVAFAVARPLAGRYQVAEVVAVGEGGILLWANDLRTRRTVAIKALRTDWIEVARARGASSEELIARVRHARHTLQTERRILVRLRNAGCNAIPHPNDYVYDLCPALADSALDAFLVENEPYLVLGRLEGVSLDEVLARHFPGGVGEAQALEWIGTVVKVLEVLQEPWRLSSGRTWHCVYQDLKPANIVIDPLGRASLLDFGGCQVVVDGVPVLEGACTPGYCAPECLGPSARVLLPCADVYAIGSTLYHMLTGIDPRDGARGRPGVPPDLRELPPRCSPGVRRLLERCLAPRPSERLADARRVAEALASLTAA